MNKCLKGVLLVLGFRDYLSTPDFSLGLEAFCLEGVPGLERADPFHFFLCFRDMYRPHLTLLTSLGTLFFYSWRGLGRSLSGAHQKV